MKHDDIQHYDYCVFMGCMMIDNSDVSAAGAVCSVNNNYNSV